MESLTMRTLAATALALTCSTLAAGLIGCNTNPAPAADPSPAPVLASHVPIVAKVSSTDLVIEESTLELLTAEQFDALGLRPLFEQQGVEVDFEAHSVLLFALGQQNSGGFAADIIALQVKADLLYVQGTAIAPGPNEPATQALTYPACAVALPKQPDGLELRSDITSLP